VTEAKKVDVNTADLAELMTLPGIGEKEALAIIENVRDYGPSFDLDELCGEYGVLTQAQVDAIRDRAVAIVPESEN
jgi:DNA uptake protein ComE-like DNA-binding protein